MKGTRIVLGPPRYEDSVPKTQSHVLSKLV